jgi:hypothetical protein
MKERCCENKHGREWEMTRFMEEVAVYLGVWGALKYK